MQQQLERLYIQSKLKEIEVARSNSTRLVFGKRPEPPQLAERILMRVSAKRRDLRLQSILTASGLLDEEWYLRQYPDVAESNMTAAHHYLHHGAQEMRDPGPAFSTRDYLSMHPDVRDEGVNPLLHYLHFGWAEMRAIRPSGLRAS
ncbi:hypothetical protein [Erythrobacter rubeus]|uniref:Uncharacterized protein n=1 Tax=Erythrobacter rubeus TaxID=2760803 RepID=A0ABR8KL28_9SPHN|nr:hypothetical protein [Erythrobacter rubeus]MBD2841041.1 hypothetical protein [Erythrobacter rubeus]